MRILKRNTPNQVKVRVTLPGGIETEAIRTERDDKPPIWWLRRDYANPVSGFYDGKRHDHDFAGEPTPQQEEFLNHMWDTRNNRKDTYGLFIDGQFAMCSGSRDSMLHAYAEHAEDSRFDDKRLSLEKYDYNDGEDSDRVVIAIRPERASRYNS